MYTHKWCSLFELSYLGICVSIRHVNYVIDMWVVGQLPGPAEQPRRLGRRELRR